ncbi:hypothetical protein ALP94_00162 [Pseudomonas savastanoi pv. glycinea]|uniref:hypothetical protein n=1 Tax=Pseudomonas quasicaspiana TaxID=2829821 RepID=UPI000EFE9E98|nr:hypothetical protein [Pseudomonas quasicaspiana]MCD5976017.1 hypothetical protein [Pseudomonas quasicaspiana]RMR02814.1 hypothetical protein ALP94_00162 [Pseudomonas savastanoi pv. glycinea]
MTSQTNARSSILPSPVVLEAQNGTIQLSTLGDSATVSVTYPGMAAGQSVGVRWSGKVTYNTPIQVVTDINALHFLIPKGNIEADLNASATVTYSVGSGNDPIRISTPLSVKVIA